MEELRTAAGPQRRAIPDDFAYNPKKLKNLKNILHNVSVALGTLSSAQGEFSKLKAPEISPDGMLGGVGYIMTIRDIKQGLITSIHTLSNLADCIADELHNPRWNAEEDKEVQDLLEEKEKVEDKLEEAPKITDEISPDDVTTVQQPQNVVEQKQDPVQVTLASAIRRNMIAGKIQEKESRI